MSGKRFVVAAIGALIAFSPRDAAAVDIAVVDSAPHVEVHGFVSPGFILSSDSNYLAKSKKGSFEFSEVGLNLTVPLTDKLRTGIQLFTHDLGYTGNYSLKADWFYLDYKFDDWLGIRAGRVKIPFGLYNEINDVDAARVPVLLPQSVYPLANRDYLLAQTGVEIYGRIKLKKAGALEYRHYLGTIFLDAESQTTVNTGTQITNVEIPFVAGERLMWETPVDGLRLGGSLQALRLDVGAVTPTGQLGIGSTILLWVTSLEYSADALLLAAEYSRWRVGINANIPLPPSSRRSESERGYVMASYRLGPHFQPGLYYSLFYPDTRIRSGPTASQHDVALTLRFDINSWWLVKLEGHFMSGTAGLSSELNDNEPLDSLERRWGVFLAKSTVHF